MTPNTCNLPYFYIALQPTSTFTNYSGVAGTAIPKNWSAQILFRIRRDRNKAPTDGDNITSLKNSIRNEESALSSAVSVCSRKVWTEQTSHSTKQNIKPQYNKLYKHSGWMKSHIVHKHLAYRSGCECETACRVVLPCTVTRKPPPPHTLWRMVLQELSSLSQL